MPAARNVPTSKRSTAVGVITAASYAGTALAFGLSPLLITKLGWQWVFYLFGGAALVWLPFWLPINVYSQLPTSSSRGGKTTPHGGGEQQALLPSTPSSSAATAVASSSSSSSSDSITGFRALLRRREVWAICVCQYSQSYGMYGLLTWLPTFFSEYYEVQVGDLGGYTLLPYFVQVGYAGGDLLLQSSQVGGKARGCKKGSCTPYAN
jgi:ACS family sodium-dependent inorganic phosphate cotransporter